MEGNLAVVEAEAAVDASVAAFAAVLAGGGAAGSGTAVSVMALLGLMPALAVALAGLMMIRCSGLRMGR